MSKSNSRLTVLAASILTTAACLSPLAVTADDDNVGDFSVSLEQATTIAMEQVPGTVIGAEVESEDGAAVWEIEIRDADGVIYEIELDANNGEVLEVEQDD